jgi:VanZ family protein
MIRKELLNYLLLLWVVIILVVSSLPADRLPALDGFNLDKLLHITVYFILGYLILQNYQAGFFSTASVHSILLAAVVFACLDEAHQSFITNRSVSVYDLSANLAGLFISYFLFRKRYFS